MELNWPGCGSPSTPEVVSTCRKHGRGVENDLGSSDVEGGPGRAGHDGGVR